MWRLTNVAFRDFQSIHRNASQGLLQGTSTASMGTDLKFICWKDISQSSLLLLCKTVFGLESDLKLHDCHYSDCFHSSVESELKNVISSFTNLKLVLILLPSLNCSSYCLLISAFHSKL